MSQKMCARIRPDQKGFNLVELMIAVALFGILATLGVSSYRVWIQNSYTRTAAESIQTGIQIARAEAVKRNARVQLDLRGTNSAWTVCTQPAVPGACPNPDDVTTVQSRSASEGSSSNITVGNVTDAGPYVFSGLGILVSPLPSAADGFIRIGLSNSTLTGSDQRNLQVVIAVGGSSKVCDPSTTLSANDPRKCP